MTADNAATFTELPLLIWLSPSFPVGGFAFSHGLESAVDAGLVMNAGSLGHWIADLVAYGSIRQDALLVAAAWRAVDTGDPDALLEINDLALALCSSRERWLETTTMGNAFVVTMRATSPNAMPAELGSGDTAYPIAVAAASARYGLPLGATLAAFVLSVVANLVSAALRLSIIGQTDGQRVTLAAVPAIEGLASQAERSSLDDLGACAFRADLAALQHETQYSRLFRS